MEAGDYGLCLSCEEDIPDKRLSAIPWAKYCIPCQESIHLENHMEERPFRLAS